MTFGPFHRAVSLPAILRGCSRVGFSLVLVMSLLPACIVPASADDEASVETVHVYRYVNGVPQETVKATTKGLSFTATLVAELSDGTAEYANKFSYLDYRFTTSDNSIATVGSSSGLVNIKDDGTAYIDVKCTDTRTQKVVSSTRLKLVCTNQRDYYISALSIQNLDTDEVYDEGATAKVDIGDVLALGLQATWTDGKSHDIENVSWKVLDKNLGTVTSKGVYSALALGANYVRVSCSGGSNINRAVSAILYITCGNSSANSSASSITVKLIYEKNPSTVVKQTTYSIAAFKQLGLTTSYYTQVADDSAKGYATVSASGVLVSKLITAMGVAACDSNHVSAFYLGVTSSTTKRQLSYSEMFAARYYYPNYSILGTSDGAKSIVAPILAISEHRSAGSDETADPDDTSTRLCLEMGYGGLELSNISSMTIVMPGGGGGSSSGGTGGGNTSSNGNNNGNGNSGGTASGSGGSGTASSGSSSSGTGQGIALAAASALRGTGQAGTGQKGTGDDATSGSQYSVFGISPTNDNPTTSDLYDNPYWPLAWVLVGISALIGAARQVYAFRRERRPWPVKEKTAAV